MKAQFGIRSLLSNHPIVPVVNIIDLNRVEPVIEQLHRQGINCIEITLRSPVAMDAVKKALSFAPKGFVVGVGTIVSKNQVMDCSNLGAHFLVSPGLNDELVGAFNESGTAFLPGVMTPSEIIKAQSLGFDSLKLFPYNVAGGLTALKAYEQVFPLIGFCPTGGINQSTYEEVSACNNVFSVGGSWVLKS